MAGSWPEGARPVLVGVTGLPGTGKSTVASAVAVRLRATLLPLAWILGALRDVSVPSEVVPSAAYTTLARLARVQLEHGGSVVLDAMAGSAAVRRDRHAVATEARARFVAVECICSDPDLHRRRVATRKEDVPGWVTPGWDHVEAMTDRFEPWTGERLVVDAIQPVEHGVTAILDAARPTRGTGR